MDEINTMHLMEILNAVPYTLLAINQFIHSFILTSISLSHTHQMLSRIVPYALHRYVSKLLRDFNTHYTYDDLFTVYTVHAQVIPYDRINTIQYTLRTHA